MSLATVGFWGKCYHWRGSPGGRLRGLVWLCRWPRHVGSPNVVVTHAVQGQLFATYVSDGIGRSMQRGLWSAWLAVLGPGTLSAGFVTLRGTRSASRRHGFFSFPGQLWLCASCLTLCARQFHVSDWCHGFSRSRLRLSEGAIAEAAMWVVAYVGRGVTSSSGVSAAASQSGDPYGSIGINRRTRRRRIARRQGPVAVDDCLPQTLEKDDVFRRSCIDLGAHAPCVWQQAIMFFTEFCLQHSRLDLDWDLLFDSLLHGFMAFRRSFRSLRRSFLALFCTGARI